MNNLFSYLMESVNILQEKDDDITDDLDAAKIDTGDDTGSDSTDSADDTSTDDTTDTDTDTTDDTTDTDDSTDDTTDDTTDDSDQTSDISGDDTSADDTTTDDTSTDDVSTDTADTGTPPGQAIKKKQLIRNFRSVYEYLNQAIVKFQSIPATSDEEKDIIDETIFRLKKIKTAMYDYLDTSFQNESYESNLYKFYFFKDSMKFCAEIVQKIKELRDEK
ncbi:hypothetical protein V6O07_04755 [Arthrospira platensis SPKY2]